jgi:hypothetical protein
MPTATVMSASHALGLSALLIMLMTAQGTTPKNCSMEVQHWIAVATSSFSSIQRSVTTANLAILSSATSGIPAVET